MQADFIERVRALAQQACVSEGCRLYDLEFSGGQNGRTLRVYIDREPTVSLDDCANVSRGLNELLDVEDVIPGGQYDLEVSSPGLERRLSERWHFEKVIGEPVRVRTSDPVTGGIEGMVPSTLVDGRLLRIDGDDLVIEKEKREWVVPMSKVSKANLRFEPPAAQGPKGKKKKR
jgi:ribosome maturation factor RimP